LDDARLQSEEMADVLNVIRAAEVHLRDLMRADLDGCSAWLR